MSNAYVLLGEAIAEVIDGALDGLGVRKDKDEYLRKQTEAGRKIFEKAAISAAFEYLGVEFDSEEPINSSTVTQAINAAFLEGTGLELTNVFDRGAIKSDLEGFALDGVNESLGGEIVLTSFKAGAMKKVAKQYLARRLREEVASGAGSLLDVLPDDDAVTASIEAYREAQSRPLSNHPDADGNRERQATFRQNHTFSWRPK